MKTTGYSFKVMKGTVGVWKSLVECEVNHKDKLEEYLLGKKLPYHLKEISGCPIDHNNVENFNEEGNPAYIESGDLEGAVCFSCNKEFKKKASQRFATVSVRRPGYTCENRGKGCKVIYCHKCFTIKLRSKAGDVQQRKSKRVRRN